MKEAKPELLLSRTVKFGRDISGAFVLEVQGIEPLRMPRESAKAIALGIMKELGYDVKVE